MTQKPPLAKLPRQYVVALFGIASAVGMGAFITRPSSCVFRGFGNLSLPEG
jgi:hypothetical protein